MNWTGRRVNMIRLVFLTATKCILSTNEHLGVHRPYNAVIISRNDTRTRRVDRIDLKTERMLTAALPTSRSKIQKLVVIANKSIVLKTL